MIICARKRQFLLYSVPFLKFLHCVDIESSSYQFIPGPENVLNMADAFLCPYRPINTRCKWKCFIRAGPWMTPSWPSSRRSGTWRTKQQVRPHPISHPTTSSITSTTRLHREQTLTPATRTHKTARPQPIS